MSTLSQADIRQRVSEALKIVAVGQGIRPADGETIDNAFADVLAHLKQDESVDWDINQIPQYAAIPLTLLVAAASAEGCCAVNPDRHKQNAIGAESKLRALAFERDKDPYCENEPYI